MVKKRVIIGKFVSYKRIKILQGVLLWENIIFRVVRVTLTTLLWIIFLLQHTHKCFLIFYIMSTPVAWSHVTIMTLLQE